VTAGQYKGSPVLSRLPDLTVVFGALAILACFVRTGAEHGRIPKAFGSVALVYFLLTPGLAFVRPSFGIQQASQFSTLTLLATAALVLLLRSDRTVRYLIGPIALLGGYFAVLALTGKAASSPGRYSALSTNPIQTGRLIGVALIWVVVVTLGRRIPRLLRLLVSVGLIVALVGTSSRGPLFTVVLAILLALLVAPRADRRRAVSTGYRALVALIIVVALYAGYAYAPVYSRYRIFSVGSSGNDRLEMWRATIAAIPATWCGLRRLVRLAAVHPPGGPGPAARRRHASAEPGATRLHRGRLNAWGRAGLVPVPSRAGGPSDRDQRNRHHGPGPAHRVHLELAGFGRSQRCAHDVPTLRRSSGPGRAGGNPQRNEAVRSHRRRRSADAECLGRPLEALSS